jgi:hypothetical protein
VRAAIQFRGDAFEPNLTRAEAGLRIAAMDAKRKREPPHTLWVSA